jgi:hypothetical protein
MSWRCMEGWSYTPTFCSLQHTRWMWVVSFSPGHSNSGERAPSTDWTGEWVCPGTSIDDMEKRKFLILLGLHLLGGPPHSQSLYWPHYHMCVYVCACVCGTEKVLTSYSSNENSLVPLASEVLLCFSQVSKQAAYSIYLCTYKFALKLLE